MRLSNIQESYSLKWIEDHVNYCYPFFSYPGICGEQQENGPVQARRRRKTGNEVHGELNNLHCLIAHRIYFSLSGTQALNTVRGKKQNLPSRPLPHVDKMSDPFNVIKLSTFFSPLVFFVGTWRDSSMTKCQIKKKSKPLEIHQSSGPPVLRLPQRTSVMFNNTGLHNKITHCIRWRSVRVCFVYICFTLMSPIWQNFIWMFYN